MFLFIAIALMRNTLIEKERIKEVAVAYQENQKDIYLALNKVFEKDFCVPAFQ